MKELFIEELDTVLQYLLPFLAVVTARYPILYRNAWVTALSPAAQKQPYDFLAAIFAIPVMVVMLWGVYRIAVSEGIVSGLAVFAIYQGWNWLIVKQIFNFLVRNDDVLRPLVLICSLAMCGLVPWLWVSLP